MVTLKGDAQTYRLKDEVKNFKENKDCLMLFQASDGAGSSDAGAAGRHRQGGGRRD